MLDFTMSTSTCMSVFGASCDLLSGPVGGPSTAADTMGVARTPDATLGTALLTETGTGASAVELVSLPAEIVDEAVSLLSTTLDAVGVLELLKLLVSAVDDVFNGELTETAAGLACIEWGLMVVGIEEDDPRTDSGGGPDRWSAAASPTEGWTSEEEAYLAGLSTADD